MQVLGTILIIISTLKKKAQVIFNRIIVIWQQQFHRGCKLIFYMMYLLPIDHCLWSIVYCLLTFDHHGQPAGCPYSALKLFTGLAKAAFTALYPTVSHAMITDIRIAKTKTSHPISI